MRWQEALIKKEGCKCLFCRRPEDDHFTEILSRMESQSKRLARWVRLLAALVPIFGVIGALYGAI